MDAQEDDHGELYGYSEECYCYHDEEEADDEGAEEDASCYVVAHCYEEVVDDSVSF